MRSGYLLVFLTVAACGRFGFDGTDPNPDAATADTADGLARITVEQTGPMMGTVMGTNGFSCTAAACTLAVPIGTPVWLRGVAGSDVWFGGWTGMCGGNFECKFDATGDVTIGAEFSPMPNRMFVTSTTTDGAFGGIAGGDAICAARATAVGLPGTYLAYLSDSTTNAASRFSTSRGWVRLDGAPFADAPTAFTTGKIVFPPRLDEYGDDVASGYVFTGTNLGVATAKLCADWTSNSAVVDASRTLTQLAVRAMNASTTTCDKQARLMCLEVGRNVPVEVRPDVDSRLAFASRTKWTPGNGRASADAVCAADAAGAGLAGTFLAAVATTTESIESRFPAGLTYRRVDGVRLLRGPGLFATDFLDVPAELDQLGAPVDYDYWTGTRRFGVVAQPIDNCSDWSINLAAVNGEMHLTAFTDMRSSAKTDQCDLALPVLCLQH